MIKRKKSFNRDSEAERENAVKAHLLSSNMAWLFVDKELMLLSLTSTKWPSKLKASQKLSMIEGECYNLKIKDNEYPCRFLTKGPAKKVEQEMAHYRAEIEEGKRPSDLRKKVLTSSKAPMVEVDFLSSSCPPIMTSADKSWKRQWTDFKEIDVECKSATNFCTKQHFWQGNFSMGKTETF